MKIFLLWLSLTAAAFAQATPQQSAQPVLPPPAPVATPAPAQLVVTAAPVAPPEAAGQPANTITLPAGTKIPIVIKHAISTKNAQENDPIYAETNFPVVVNDRIIVPAGTYVQGSIIHVERAGRLKGRGEILVHFTTLIFPNGYTVMLPGALDSIPGAEHATVGEEGAVKGEGKDKGKAAETIGKTTATGTTLGGLGGLAGGRPGLGMGVGAGTGAAVGLVAVLLTRGPELRIESGSTLEMVLERPVTIDRDRANARN